MNNINIKYITLVVCTLVCGSCRKLVEIDPPDNRVGRVDVYANNATAASVLTGIYSTMSSNTSMTGERSISSLCGMAADELQVYDAWTLNAVLSQAYANALLPTSDLAIWSEMYKYVYYANAAIEGISASSAVTGPMRDQLLGEARFVRAFAYFYLVNLFGDVPLLTKTDYNLNRVASRTPVADVYKLVIEDLETAQSLLKEEYVAPDGQAAAERIRPNRFAATALLARACLYTGAWEKAEAAATAVIERTATYDLEDDPANVFLSGSREIIWQLVPTIPGYNTLDGNFFILNNGLSYNTPCSMSELLLNDFEPNDTRRTKWVGVYSSPDKDYYYPFKYKVKGGPAETPVTEYLVVLRLAEQYLIRAEARARQHNFDGAANDLDEIRNRAGLDDYDGVKAEEPLADAILEERRVELFTEFGHRWLDLKRTGKIDAVMSAVALHKGSTWNADWQLFPISALEIQYNSNLVQNKGYK